MPTVSQKIVMKHEHTKLTLEDDREDYRQSAIDFIPVSRLTTLRILFQVSFQD